jgi:hypothetical protein
MGEMQTEIDELKNRISILAIDEKKELELQQLIATK